MNSAEQRSLSGLDGAELVEALLLRARTVPDHGRRADLYHQAGLAAELRANDPSLAVRCYILALESNPDHNASRDALLVVQDDPAFDGKGLEGDNLGMFFGEDLSVEALGARAERRLGSNNMVGAVEDLNELLLRDPDNRQGLLLSQELYALEEGLSEMSRGAQQAARRIAEVTLDESLQSAARVLAARLSTLSEATSPDAPGVLHVAVKDAGQDFGAIWSYQRLMSTLGRGEDLVEALVAEVEGHEAPEMKLGAALDAAVKLVWDQDAYEKALDMLQKAIPDEKSGLPRLDLSVGLELAAILAREYDPEVELDLLRELGQRLDSSHRQAAVFTRIGQLIIEQDIDPKGIEGEKALRYFEAAIEAEPSYRPALTLLSELHEEGGFPQKARDMLRRRAEQSRRADLMLEASRITLDKLGRRDEALVLLRQAIAMSDEAELLGPGSLLDALGDFVVGSASPAADRHQIMEEALLRVESRQARCTLLRRMVDLAIEDGEDELALRVLERLVVEDPEDLFQNERLADLQSRFGAWSELGELRRRELEWFETRDPEQAPEVMYALGRLCQVALRDEEHALGWYRAILDRKPDDLAALSAAGRILVRNERWEELAALYQRELDAVSTPARQASMAFRLATLHERVLGDPATAKLFYDRVRQSNANHLPSLFGLVRVAEASKDWELWTELVSEWSERERDDVLAGTLSCELAYVLEAHMGDLATAYEAYRRAMERLPKLELARLGMIRCLYRLGRRGEAARLAVQRQPTQTGEESPEERLDTLRAVVLLGDGDLRDIEALLSEFPEHTPSVMATLREALLRRDHVMGSELAARLAQLVPQGNVSEGMARLSGVLGRLAGQDEGEDNLPTMASRPMDEMSLLRLEARYRDVGDLEQLGAVMEQRAALASDLAIKAAYSAAHARTLQARGQFEAATAAYKNVMVIQPDFVPAAKALRLLYEMLGDREGLAVAAEMEGSIARDPRTAVQDFLTAGDLRRRHLGDINGAIQDLENALRIDPTEKDAFEFLREIYSLQGEDERLLQLLSRRSESLVDIEERKSLLLIMAQVALIRLKDREMSIGCHKRVLELDPRHIQSMRILAELYQTDERWVEAVKVLKRVIGASDDKNLLAMTLRAIAELYDTKLANPVGAIDAYIAMMNHDPDHVPSLQRLGELLVNEQRWEDAAKTYGRLLQLERRRTRLIADLKALAMICQRGLNDPERAEQCLQQALKLNNQEIEIHQLLVEHYRSQGQSDKLSAHLDQAGRQFMAAFLEDMSTMEPLSGLFQTAVWQKHNDRAFYFATIAESFGEPNEAQIASLTSSRGRSEPPIPTKPIPIDMTAATIPAELSMSLLHVMRTGHGSIRRIFSVNLRELGISRRTRLSERSNRPGAKVVLSWPKLFSLRDVVVHVVPTAPMQPRAYLHDQPLLVLSPEGLEAAAQGDPNFLFDLGLALSPLSMGIGTYINMSPEVLIASIAAIVRHSAATYLLQDDRSTHPHINEERLGRHLSKKGDTQLAPHSLDVSGRFDGTGLLFQRKLLQRAFERLSLIPLYDPSTVLARVKAEGGDEAHEALVHFMLSDSYRELREAVGIAIP